MAVPPAVVGAWYASEPRANALLSSIGEWRSGGDPTIWLFVELGRTEIGVTF